MAYFIVCHMTKYSTVSGVIWQPDVQGFLLPAHRFESEEDEVDLTCTNLSAEKMHLSRLKDGFAFVCLVRKLA